MSKENLLYHYCRWNSHNKANKLLSTCGDEKIDILYDDGILFKLALSSEGTELLKVLLDYCYDRYHLEDNPEVYNSEQKKIKHGLLEIFEDSVVSEEMQKVIESYGLNITGDDAGSVCSEVENISSIQNEIREIEKNRYHFSQENLSTKGSPNKEEDEFAADRKYEETSVWDLSQLKSGLTVNEHEGTTVVLVGSALTDFTDHHSD